MMPIKHLLADKPLLLIAILYSCLISVLFFIPSQDLPNVQISALDKIIHVFIYFILVNLWMLYLYKKNDFRFNNKWMLTVLLSVLLYGIIIEILQGLLTISRSADIFDVAANLIGSLIGIYFFKSVKNKFKT
ncbi:VanZ family protein [Aequorivita todarodis]|uniref:VanZ family protein n=1 Tax=Aequorivita todarodis TaxID=2036821 RepID=UPI0023508BE0|nr:VanZ family protein [Aequorivita todarodis]MDC7999435.1 VanZ family protein [Aequorivita todarodis]